MLSLTSTYKVLKALKVPDAEISRVLGNGEHDVELPDVFVYEPAEMKVLKNKWKSRGKRMEAAA